MIKNVVFDDFNQDLLINVIPRFIKEFFSVGINVVFDGRMEIRPTKIFVVCIGSSNSEYTAFPVSECPSTAINRSHLRHCIHIPDRGAD